MNKRPLTVKVVSLLHRGRNPEPEDPGQHSGSENSPLTQKHTSDEQLDSCLASVAVRNNNILFIPAFKWREEEEVNTAGV